MIPAHLSAILTTARQLNLGTSLLQALAYLSIHREVTATALAKHIGISSAAVTGLIDNLEKRGHVIRRDIPGDRRVHMICITPAGDATVSQLCRAAA